MQKKIKFTIISPAFNARDGIEKTYESVRMQQDADWEYLVIDGMSTDGSQEQYALWEREDDNFRFVSEKDAGIYDAMNKGTKLATGDYVLFLGAGDCLANEFVLKDMKEVIKKENPDICYGYVMFCHSDEKKEVYCRKIDKTYPFRADPISHQAVFARVGLLKENPFDLHYRIAADQDWIMKMYKGKRRFLYADVTVADYDMAGVSATKEGKKAGAAELRQIHKKYYPLYYLVHEMLRRINKMTFKYKRVS